MTELEQIVRKHFNVDRQVFSRGVADSYDQKVAQLIQELTVWRATAVRAAREDERREILEGLLEWQDQEVDLDGRPVSGPYYVICADDRDRIEFVFYGVYGATKDSKKQDEK